MQLTKTKFLQLFLSVGTALVIWTLFKVVGRIIRSFKSPLRNIRGPDSSHWLYGNFEDIFRTVRSFLAYLHCSSYTGTPLKLSRGSLRTKMWLNSGSKNTDLRWRYTALLAYVTVSYCLSFPLSEQDLQCIQEPLLCTMDSRAINHVLSHPYNYQKPEVARYLLSGIVGGGGYAVFVISTNLSSCWIHTGILLAEGDPHKQQVGFYQNATILIWFTPLIHRERLWWLELYPIFV